jgi:hypothetical protein
MAATGQFYCPPVGRSNWPLTPGDPDRPMPMRLGLRWIVEATNSWLANYGQLRRNTDRCNRHRQAALSLAITIMITIKLIKWRDRYLTN